MTDDLSVSRHETGVTRLFAINLPEGQVIPFATGDGARLGAALGIDHVDHDFVEVISVADLQTIGLSGYLTEGIGVSARAIEADRARLDALDGHVLLVDSQAFGGMDATLDPSEDLTFIAAFREPAHAPSLEPIRSDGATGTVTPANIPVDVPPGRRYSPGWLVIAGLALAALVVWLVS